MLSNDQRRDQAARRSGRRLSGVAAAAAALVAFAPTVLAGGATVTTGEFHAFNGSTLPITGQATMIRTADGRTIVAIQVRGLTPDTEYGSHVHKQACADGLAGTHYRFDPAGPATPPNEIWPGPFTTNAAGAGNGGTTADGTAGPTAVSVVVHAPGGAKIACADLSSPTPTPAGA
jgi:hypothetical protein